MEGGLRAVSHFAGGADHSIGQEPPPQMKEEEHDGRTLFERLEEQKVTLPDGRADSSN